MNDEVHIISLIVHVKPEEMDNVLLLANQLPEAECHTDDKHHKFIVIFEANSDSELNSYFDEINSWAGVLSSQLCYHHCEPVESLKEEIRYATHTS